MTMTRLRSPYRLGARAAPASVLLSIPIALTACAGFSEFHPIPDTANGGAFDGGAASLDAASNADALLDATPTAADASTTDAAWGDADGGPTDAADVEASPTAPAKCDPATDPTAPPCLTGALFVSTSGSDTNDGTPQRPFATVGYALHQPNPVGRIYICKGQYTERVALSATAVANLYGGFSCPSAAADASAIASDGGEDGGAASGWAPGGGSSVFATPTYDPVNNWSLSVIGVTAPVHLQSLQFVAPTPSAAGSSSIAAFVIGSAVELDSVSLTAARAIDGPPGASGVSRPNYTDAKAPDGTAASTDGAGNVLQIARGGANTCKYGHGSGGASDSSAGGNGGEVKVDGSGLVTPSTSGTANPLPPPMPPQDGAAGSVGHAGAPGASYPAGAASTSLGSLVAGASSVLWQASSGASGAAGGVGQGGGGADGKAKNADEDLPGGSGGAGGCGGSGGAGGGGGGASIALVSVSSPSLTLKNCTLATGGGGTGGVGGPGQDGQPGGLAASGLGSLGKDGGNGGHGAGGSGGGGGTGGISTGVLYRGSAAPSLQSCTLNIGDPGHGGMGGAPGGPNASPGLAGLAGYDEYAAYGTNLASVRATLLAP